jgi:drug/metabolite transporter (DMT)-like permease
MSAKRGVWAGTAAGLLAILSWSTLAALSAAASFPPFQLAAMTFGLAGGVGLLLAGPSLYQTGTWRQPVATWLIGGGGLFIYHAMYFAALRYAPPERAGLLNQLWPLFFALLTVCFLKERFGALHLAALTLAAGGSSVLLLQNGMTFVPSEVTGYALALACALTWAAYSVALRARPEVPSALVAGFCLLASVLALACHGAFEVTAWPSDAADLLPVALLALGPAGGAFFAWDFGVKHGNAGLLGALAFATPVLSSLFLVLLGRAEASWRLATACLAITAAAILAHRATSGRRRGAGVAEVALEDMSGGSPNRVANRVSGHPGKIAGRRPKSDGQPPIGTVASVCQLGFPMPPERTTGSVEEFSSKTPVVKTFQAALGV